MSLCFFLRSFRSEKNDDVSLKLRECEQRSLGIGTRLADEYNAPLKGEEADSRLHQDYMTEHLGFAPWMAGGTWKSGGKNHFLLPFPVYYAHNMISS